VRDVPMKLQATLGQMLKVTTQHLQTRNTDTPSNL